MILFEREIKMELDMCEFYRQNYEDALDENHELKKKMILIEGYCSSHLTPFLTMATAK